MLLDAFIFYVVAAARRLCDGMDTALDIFIMNKL